jgi:hypothetical protein
MVLIEPHQITTIDLKIAIFSNSKINVYYKIKIWQKIYHIRKKCQNILWGLLKLFSLLLFSVTRPRGVEGSLMEICGNLRQK